MKDIAFLCLSHGAYVRNIVYSKLFEALVERFDLKIIFSEGVEVPAGDLDALRGCEILHVKIRQHRAESGFVFLRKNVFAGRERTQTFNLINEIEKLKHPFAYRIASFANSLLGHFPAIGRWWQRVEARFIPGDEFSSLLDNYRPALVLTANYGTEPLEIRLLRAAHRRGIPTLAIVPSWDNLSSKGVIGEPPRYLAVWNRIMQEEAKSLYGFAPDTVGIVGGLQFDRFAEPFTAQERKSVYDRLGIDPDRPYVVLGTITPKYFPHNLDLVDILVEDIEQGRLPSDMQLVARLHPQVIRDRHFGDNIEEYQRRAAKSACLKLSIPRVREWGVISPPMPEDFTELGVLLSGAVAAVMPASTLAIDACALGCPVVGIGFDGHERKPYERSVLRTFDFTHYRRIVALNGMRIAKTREEALREIQAYMADRDRDAEGRAAIVRSHLGDLDGRAWQRVMALAESVAARNRYP
ncbi:MAG: hypothetical protein ABW023_03140 [Sphingomonas sp.]